MEAASAGSIAEVVSMEAFMDIADLAEASKDMPIDVQKVFTNLMNGSSNHLAAFTNAIERETSQ